MQLSDFIDKRRSVRQYTIMITEEIKDKLKNFIKNLKPLYPEIGYEIKIVERDKVKSKVSAPEYILFFSEEREGKELNAGFMLQQIDLFLQSEGAGTCWLGLATTEEKSEKGFKFVIMLSVGMTEKALRNSKDDFLRKPLDEVGNLSDKNLLEGIRLSPSAVNRQPWYFEQREKDIIDVYLDRKILENLFLKRFNMIDIGISLCHLYVGLIEQGKRFEIINKKDAKNCVISLKLVQYN